MKSIARYFGLSLFAGSAILIIWAVLGKEPVEVKLEKVKTETYSPEEAEMLYQFVYSDLINSLDSLLELSVRRYSFNGNLAVAKRGWKIYSKAYGYSDFTSKEELSPSSIFQLASISKQFTAMAIMMLKEKGKLNYDDKITKFLPELNYEKTTIRHLLNHTAGTQNYMWLLENKWKYETIPYNTNMIKLMSDYSLPLNFSSGRRFDYSNTNYALLALIVERITGFRFGDYLEMNIFEPLGMKNTFVYSAAYSNKAKDKVDGYYRYKWRYRKISDNVNDGTVGDKGVCSTIEDMLIWDRALYTDRIVSQETLKEAFENGKTRYGYKIAYGFGFRLKTYKGKRVVYHHGQWSGFRNTFERHIEDSLSFIMLTNTDLRSKNTIDKKILSILYQDLSAGNTEFVVNELIENGEFANLFKFSNREFKISRLLSLAEFLYREMNKEISAGKVLDLIEEIKLNTEEFEVDIPLN